MNDATEKNILSTLDNLVKVADSVQTMLKTLKKAPTTEELVEFKNNAKLLKEADASLRMEFYR